MTEEVGGQTELGKELATQRTVGITGQVVPVLACHTAQSGRVVLNTEVDLPHTEASHWSEVWGTPDALTQIIGL